MMIGVTFFGFVATGLVLALAAVGVLIVLPALVRRNAQSDAVRRHIQSEKRAFRWAFGFAIIFA